MSRSAACVRVLAFLGLACGDPTAPRGIASTAFDVDAQLSSDSISLSSTTDSVVVSITVRNPWPVRATIRQPMPDYSTHVWWTIDIIRDASWGETGSSRMINGGGELTLEAHQVVRHRIVLRRRDVDDLQPAEYRVLAGILFQNAYAGRLVVTP